MSKEVDFFFPENSQDTKVKMRKTLRAKIRKVHDVLYKYSHEKVTTFLQTKELAAIFARFVTQSEDPELHSEAYAEAIEDMHSRSKSALE